MRKALRKLKGWEEMKVLCINDQDHQWWVIAVDHTNKFKAIKSIVTLKMKPHFRNYQINHKIVDIIVQNWEKGRSNTKNFSETTRVD